jgi:fluoride ion exporter CrcB/FEX
VVATALQVGVAGALSTVSTLAAEATAMLRQAPADASGYAYLAVTWGAAVAVGVVVYGVGGVWA